MRLRDGAALILSVLLTGPAVGAGVPGQAPLTRVRRRDAQQDDRVRIEPGGLYVHPRGWCRASSS